MEITWCLLLLLAQENTSQLKKIEYKSVLHNLYRDTYSKINFFKLGTTKLVPGSVGTTKLVPGYVGTTKLVPGYVGTTKLVPWYLLNFILQIDTTHPAMVLATYQVPPPPLISASVL